MARKKRKLAMPQTRPADNSWATVGVDISLSSIAGAMLVYDGVLDAMRGPGIFSVRFERNVHFLDRLGEAARAHNFIFSLMQEVGPMTVPTENIWIGVEEPWPAGMVKRSKSQWLRQQAQMHGAFMGGLFRFGYRRIYEVNSQLWKNPIRDELEISEPDKWDVKRWAIEAYELPDLPDLINSSRGLIPKPADSKAKPRQPDDVYDAAGVLAWMDDTRREEVS